MSARALLLAALLALPLASAQIGSGGTVVNPIDGGYTEVYVITGRVVDALGQPVRTAEVVVDLEQRGVNAAPVRAATDCFGTYITYFTIRLVDPRGKIHATLRGQDGAPDAKGEAHLDPFFRRTDLNLTYQGVWPESASCADQSPLWARRVTVGGRILNRTETYKEGDFSFDAKPVGGFVRLRYWYASDAFACPPSQAGADLCDPVPIDERGDFKYSWVFDREEEARGAIEIILGDKSWNASMDRALRLGIAHIEVSGRGPPPRDSPDLAAAGAVAALAAAAIAIAARRRRA